MAKVNPNTWLKYKGCIDSFHEDAFQEQILWLRHKGEVDRFGEDKIGTAFDQIVIRGLLQYNVFRNWPLTKMSETGQLDNENAVLYLNLEYLKVAGLTDNGNYLVFNPSTDMFVHRGKVYKSYGDTQAAQAMDSPLLFKMVLRREATDIRSISQCFAGTVLDIDYGKSTFFFLHMGVLEDHPDPPVEECEVRLYRLKDGSWYELLQDGTPRLINANVFETIAW